MTMTAQKEAILNKDGLLKKAPATIYLFSGGTINPLDPDPNDIQLVDIAHALGNICRWTGHVTKFLSVAEHSVLASLFTKDLPTLMHDSSEAYLSDLARPIKQAPGLGEIYLEVEAKLESAIATRFGLPQPPMSKATKAADDAMLYREARELVPTLGVEMPEIIPGTPELKLWTPEEATVAFLDRFYELGGKE
jgi:uncharacterized protein